MAGVTGFGGVFVRSKDPEALYAWYEQHLGMKRTHGSFIFPTSAQRGKIAFSFFKADDEYFPRSQPTMLNLQVDDLDALLDKLVSEGVTVDPKREKYGDFGTFGWITDPDGNRVELWQPSTS